MSLSPQKLLPPQAEVTNMGLLDSGFNCVLQMATGSGKTWLAEQTIGRVLDRGLRAVYLAPLRALASELATNWQARFKDVPVGVFTGDYGSQGCRYPVPFDKARLLVMTPERLDFCTRTWRNHWDWIPEVDLVVVDEFHLLGDGWRGGRLEGTLSRLRRLNPFARLLCLSATLGNPEELADWLGAVEYISDWRPIPLDWRVVRYRKAEEKPTLLEGVVRGCLTEGGRSLVFVQSRRRAEQLSERLNAQGLRAVHHHAGLGHERRREVETAFRQRLVDVVIATSSLEMGLNLPVRQVVLYDLQQFDGVGFSPLAVNSVWQRVGRAGRPGLDTSGEAVLLAPAWDGQAGCYEQGAFESIRSGLHDDRVLSEQMIVEVGAGFAQTTTQLQTVMKESLAAHQGLLGGNRFERVTSLMRQAGMLVEQQDDREKTGPLRLRVSPLGRVAVRHMLNPETVLRFRRVEQGLPDLTFLDLLLLVTSTPDCEPLLTVDFEELDTLAERTAREPSHLLALDQDQLEDCLGVGGRRLLSAIKMALAGRELTRNRDPDDLARELSCYPFELERLGESLERLLLALGAVLSLGVDKDQESQDADFVTLQERADILWRMMVARLDEEAITLTLVSGIGPTLARRLLDQGIRDIEDLAQAEPQDLAQIRGISLGRAGVLIEQAAAAMSVRSTLSYREEGAGFQLLPTDWPAQIDPYRLRRARELKVKMGESGRYRVTGGTDPHLVRVAAGQYRCDCADAAKGQANCKHVLAIRLGRGDRQLQTLVKRLDEPRGGGIDLFRLWTGGPIIQTVIRENIGEYQIQPADPQWGDSLSQLHTGDYLRRQVSAG